MKSRVTVKRRRGGEGCSHTHLSQSDEPLKSRVTVKRRRGREGCSHTHLSQSDEPLKSRVTVKRRRGREGCSHTHLSQSDEPLKSRVTVKRRRGREGCVTHTCHRAMSHEVTCHSEEEARWRRLRLLFTVTRDFMAHRSVTGVCDCSLLYLASSSL